MFDPAKKGVQDKQYLAQTIKEIDRIQREVEGEDDREYGVGSKKTQ